MFKAFVYILTFFLLISCSQNENIVKKDKKESKNFVQRKENEKALVLIVKSNGFIIDDNFKKVIKLAFEEAATSKNYVIIDDKIKDEAYQRILKAHAYKQNDPRFLVELGKQVSASKMVYIEITKFAENNYKLSNRWIDLKSGEIQNTKTIGINYELNNTTKEIFYKKLKKLAEFLLTEKIENRIVITINSTELKDKSLEKIIRLAFEEVASENNYSIVDDEIKDKVFNRILKAHSYKQNDPEFLVELKKQLAAKYMIIIDITKENEFDYIFTNKLIDLKTALNMKTLNKRYSFKNDENYLRLFDTVEDLAREFLCESCVKQKKVYVKIEGNKDEYIYDKFNEIITRRGYLISNNENSVDLFFTLKIVDNGDYKFLTLKKRDKNKNMINSSLKKCKEINDYCLKLLFDKKFIPKKILNKWGVEFLEVPKGEFFMGYKGENSLEIERKNYRKVKISNGFFISSTEVTQKFYKKITGVNPSSNKCENCPVDSVSFNDMMDFIKKLNSMDDKYRYRLPSEAEWEYMARAGKDTPFFWGETEASLDQYAWYGGNSDLHSHEVALKKPNDWGIYDVV